MSKEDKNTEPTQQPQSIFSDLSNLTKSIFASKNIFTLPEFQYDENMNKAERIRKSMKRLKKMEIQNSENMLPSHFRSETSQLEEENKREVDPPSKEKAPTASKAPKEKRHQKRKTPKDKHRRRKDKHRRREKTKRRERKEKKEGELDEEDSKQKEIARKRPSKNEVARFVSVNGGKITEKIDHLDIFVKKEKYDSYGVIINNDELEGNLELALPKKGDAIPNKICEKPKPMALVADRKNFEKTRHRASSALFEFTLAREKALADAFGEKPRRSARSLFSDFEAEKEPLPPRAVLESTSGHEPAWDRGLDTHVLPGARGGSHYTKFGFPGFVPCADQSHLPQEGYTRVITSSLWVGNVPLGVGENTLREVFHPFGEIKTLSLMPGQNYAFVRFATRKAALAALKSLQRFGFGRGAEGGVKVRWAKGCGVQKENFTFVDGVSYVASADLAEMDIEPEPLELDESVMALLGESSRAYSDAPARNSSGWHEKRSEPKYRRNY